jgi:WD40 repeat protein
MHESRRSEMKTKLFFSVGLMALVLSSFVQSQEIDLIALASRAQWSTSEGSSIPFGREGRERGEAKYVTDARLEDGQTYSRVLFTHPPWQKDGNISGMIPNITIPSGGAKLVIAGGFLEGAEGTDGAVFAVSFRSTDDRSRLTTRVATGSGRDALLCNFAARYDRQIDRTECDLSGLAGQVGTIVLQVRAGNRADSDWAVWTEAKIVSGSIQPQAQSASEGTARMINAFRGHDYRIQSVRFSPNGRYVLTVDSDNQAKVWEFPGGRVKLILRGNYIQPPDISPDSRYVVIGKRGGVAEIWEIAAENIFRTLQGHNGDVFTANFSPDGKYVVTASADGYAKVWNVTTGAELLAIRHSDRSGIVVRSAAFSPDSRYVITVGEDNIARLWEIRL